MNRTQFWIAGGLVLLSVAFVGWRVSRPPRVEATVVRFQDVTSTLAVSGVLEATDRSTVSSQLTSGLVKSVLVDIGDAVTVGQILVLLDDADAQAQLLSADALIRQSDSQVHLQDTYARTAARAVSLSREALASVNDLRSSVSRARSDRDLAKAKVAQALVNLERVRNSSRTEQVRIANADLKRANQDFEQAQREAKRTAYLYREGAISKKESELAETAFLAAGQNVEVAREQVRIAATPRPEDVRTAESQLSEARASFAGATDLFELTEQALAFRLESRQQVTKAQGDLEAAVAAKGVDQASRLSGQAQRNAALSALAKTTVRSPIAGRVSQRMVEPGQTVGSGVPLIEVAGTKDLRIRLNVEESSIALVKPGAKAMVGFDAFPDLQLSAVVKEIGSAANFQLGTVEVRLALLRTDSRLKPELTVDANIYIFENSNVVVVPQSALIQTGARANVFVVDQGIVKERLVTWSRGNLGSSVILSGLKAGELVLINPRKTKVGSRVDAFEIKAKVGDAVQ